MIEYELFTGHAFVDKTNIKFNNNPLLYDRDNPIGNKKTTMTEVSFKVTNIITAPVFNIIHVSLSCHYATCIQMLSSCTKILNKLRDTREGVKKELLNILLMQYSEAPVYYPDFRWLAAKLNIDLDTKMRYADSTMEKICNHIYTNNLLQLSDLLYYRCPTEESFHCPCLVHLLQTMIKNRKQFASSIMTRVLNGLLDTKYTITEYIEGKPRERHFSIYSEMVNWCLDHDKENGTSYYGQLDKWHGGKRSSIVRDIILAYDSSLIFDVMIYMIYENTQIPLREFVNTYEPSYIILPSLSYTYTLGYNGQHVPKCGDETDTIDKHLMFYKTCYAFASYINCGSGHCMYHLINYNAGTTRIYDDVKARDYFTKLDKSTTYINDRLSLMLFVRTNQ